MIVEKVNQLIRLLREEMQQYGEMLAQLEEQQQLVNLVVGGTRPRILKMTSFFGHSLWPVCSKKSRSFAALTPSRDARRGPKPLRSG